MSRELGLGRCCWFWNKLWFAFLEDWSCRDAGTFPTFLLRHVKVDRGWRILLGFMFTEDTRMIRVK